MEALTPRAFLLLLTFIGPTIGRTVIEKKYLWMSDEWGNCYVPQGCGDGQRERSVWCEEKATKKAAPEYYCKSSDEPARTKPCFVACRHHKDHLEWRVGEWGPCLMADNDIGQSTDGLMERNVTCILTSHDRVQVSLVIDDDNCLVLGKRPEYMRECSLPSRQECVLTEWSPWTACCDSTQHRTRSVLVAPHYGAQPCPQLSEWRSCDEEDPTCESPSSASSTRLRVEKWGECRPSFPPLPGTSAQGGIGNEDESPPQNAPLWDGDVMGHADNYYKHWPQVGTQHRTVTCLDPTGVQLDIRECLNDRGEAGLPMRERACIISQDCAVSEWADWKVIQEGCIDPNGNEWADISERRREVLRLHEGQGKSCPHLIETKETKSNLPLCSHKYRWITSKWSPCTLPGEMGLVVCGGGLQFRNITCVKAEGGQPLSLKQCQTLPPPPTVQRCEEACPRDCEVTQWGAWGPCKPYPDICSTPADEVPRPLPRKGIRVRTRSVLVAPSAKGLGCPSLTEVQPCPHPRCYVWRPGPWSPCYLNTHLTKCGAGTRNRKVECVSLTGELVQEQFCTDLMPDVEESCLLPCPYDCVVSSWSSWSPCSQPCSTPTSLALRSRNRTIIAPPGHEGHPCPDPDEFMQIEGCNIHGCHGYSWMTLPWQECNATCDREGFQVREVWCSENQEQVPDDKCLSLEKPAEFRRCTKDCPTECQVSPWSEWSKCNAHTCYPNGTRGGTTIQTRYRVVLEEGKDCGPLVEHAPCPAGPYRPCPTYHWTTGNWSHCQLAKGVLCGHGLRTRDLWCTKDETDEKVELRHCLDNEDPLPVSVERCHADCHSPCQLTEWSNWSACKQPCQGVKDRTRQLIGLSAQHAACQALPLVETMPCPCAQYDPLPLSEWSSCLSNESTTCGTGTRYRAMACVDTKQQTVDPSLCGGSSGLQEEPCLLPCPADCMLGEWTAWNECSAVCGPGIQNRTRMILRDAAGNGRPCAATIETKICNTSCDVFQWQASGWSECSLLPSDRPLGCGTGDQYRQVRCVDSRTWTQVNEGLCDWAARPADINGCHVACPGDCVLSPWSEWSVCPKGCVANTQQQRTRTMLRAASNTGANCPHAIQTQPCQLNITCFTYRWVATNYSSCLPLGGSPCGEGMATRAIYCLRSDGRPVSDSYCSDLQKPNPAEKWCYTDCPVDCELAEWSEWNSSKCHCDQTGMTRHAIIATNPSSSGRPCPDVLQWRPCPATPCYAWQPGNWSECQLHGAACGHGVRTRNVSCIKMNDNSTVELWHCAGSARKPSVWEPCHSPCESDCQLSPWSEWSHCHGECLKDKTGYQTRSRAVIRPPQSAGAEPCPEALWETQPCSLGPCYTFDWTVTSTGSIVCQRSDGLHVSGGCTGKKKPRSSACHWEEDRCVCEDGAVVLQQTACSPEANEVQARMYFPNDDLNVWLFAMIGIGCVFIIFVAASIYLLCHSGRESHLGYTQSK